MSSLAGLRVVREDNGNDPFIALRTHALNRAIPARRSHWQERICIGEQCDCAIRDGLRQLLIFRLAYLARYVLDIYKAIPVQPDRSLEAQDLQNARINSLP